MYDFIVAEGPHIQTRRIIIIRMSILRRPVRELPSLGSTKVTAHVELTLQDPGLVSKGAVLFLDLLLRLGLCEDGFFAWSRLGDRVLDFAVHILGVAKTLWTDSFDNLGPNETNKNRVQVAF